MRTQWKIVMFAAVIIMLSGMALSIYGVGYHDLQATWIGLITIMAVCVSWWFWVMFIIRTMIEQTERTQSGLGEIKLGLKDIRSIVKELDSDLER
jgi:quinol-cytochrome oxidoreductase complex cytochrome b subunit